MKHLKTITVILVASLVFYFLGMYLEDHPKLYDAIPYVLIAVLYGRYETKIENLSLDLLSVEKQLETVSNGEWVCNVRFRGNPYVV